MSGAGSGLTGKTTVKTSPKKIVNTISNNGVVNGMTNSCMFISIYDWMMLRQINARTEGAEESKGDGTEEFTKLIAKSLKLSKILHIMQIYYETYLRGMERLPLGKYLVELQTYVSECADCRIMIGEYFDRGDIIKAAIFEAIYMAKNCLARVNKEIFNCMLMHNGLKISVKHLRRLIGHDIYTFHRDIDEHVRAIIKKFKEIINRYENMYMPIIIGSPELGELAIECYRRNNSRVRQEEYIKETINNGLTITDEYMRKLIGTRLDDVSTYGRPEETMSIEDYNAISKENKIKLIMQNNRGHPAQTQLVINILIQTFHSTMGDIQKVFTEGGMEDHTTRREMKIDELIDIVNCVRNIDNFAEASRYSIYQKLRNDLIPTDKQNRRRKVSIPIPLNADGQNIVEHEMWDNAYPGHRQALINLANMLSCNIYVNSSPGAGKGNQTSFTPFEYETNTDDLRRDVSAIDIKNMSIQMSGNEKETGHFQFICDETGKSKAIGSELLHVYTSIRREIAGADDNLSVLFKEYDEWVEHFYSDMIRSRKSILYVVFPVLPAKVPSAAPPAKVPSAGPPAKVPSATSAELSTATSAELSTVISEEISTAGLSDSYDQLHYEGVVNSDVPAIVRLKKEGKPKISHKHDEKKKELDYKIDLREKQMNASVRLTEEISTKIAELFDKLMLEENTDADNEKYLLEIKELQTRLNMQYQSIDIDNDVIRTLKTELSTKI